MARLTVEDSVKAGVPESEARAAWNLTHTPERIAADEKRRAALQTLVDTGMTHEQIKQAISVRLAGRIVPGNSVDHEQP